MDYRLLGVRIRPCCFAGCATRSVCAVRDRTTEPCSPSCSPTAWLSRVWMTLSPPQGWVGEKVIDRR